MPVPNPVDGYQVRIDVSRMGGTDRQRYEAIVTSSGEAILSSSLDGTIETVNPAAESLYGYSPNEMIGASIRMFGPAGIEAVAADWGQAQAGRSVSLETRARRKDGSVIDVSVTLSPLHDADGAVDGVVSVVRGVSEIARNAERLAEAESRFAGAFEAASTGMALTAPDGRFLAVNAALCRFLRRDAATLLASCVQEVTHPDDLAADVEQGKRALAGEIDSFQQAKRYVLPSGGIVWGLLTISISRDAQGAPQHYVSQVEDITDRKTAEGELRRYAAQLQALSGRDPLTGLLNERAFAAGLEEALHASRAGDNPCNVLLVEIDGDDRAVVAVADSLARATRDADLAAHLGSGQLAVLVPALDAPTAAEIEARIKHAIRRRGVRSALVTAVPGEIAGELLQRARESLPDHDALLAGEPGAEDELSNPAIQLAQAADMGVRTLLAALQARDFYTSSHSRQVVELASAVARRLGLSPEARRDVEQVALLHDIGKVGIPDAILQKQGPLDEDEWELMRQHPIVGEHIIAGTPGLSRLAPSIRAEHERWDGGGYPDGLAGDRIPLASRITLACDALNAMTSDRPYRAAMTLECAEQELHACAGTQFDPEIIRALLAETANLPRKTDADAVLAPVA